MNAIETRKPRPESPEITGDYRCQQCDNIEEFIGYDDHGFPGDTCECGEVVCQCQVTLRQPFNVNALGEVTYEAFTGGGNGAEIGSYDRVQCGRCRAQLWPTLTEAPTRPDRDAAANLPGLTATEVGGTDYQRPVGFRRRARTRSSQRQSGGKTS